MTAFIASNLTRGLKISICSVLSLPQGPRPSAELIQKLITIQRQSNLIITFKNTASRRLLQSFLTPFELLTGSVYLATGQGQVILFFWQQPPAFEQLQPELFLPAEN